MSPDAEVLLPFIRAGGQFVSGARIGEDLGLSRVSVHNRLEALRQQGFVFAAIRNKGYRMEAEPMAFHAPLFEALLENEPCLFFRSQLTIGETDSTNSLAELELSKGRETPFLVVADSQSAGRGRRGRVWHSPPHRNLYLSIALRPSLPPARLQTITLCLGLAICQFLREQFALPVLIKWPNDLLLHDRKIAGMLTEARVDAEQTRDLVFGLGLNVNAAEEDFPEDLRPIATSLSLCLARPVSLTRLAHALTHRLAIRMRDFLDNPQAQNLADSWPEFDYLRGREIHAGGISGRASGITNTGSLRVERPDGSTVLLHSGEVSLGTGRPATD